MGVRCRVMPRHRFLFATVVLLCVSACGDKDFCGDLVESGDRCVCPEGTAPTEDGVGCQLGDGGVIYPPDAARPADGDAGPSCTEAEMGFADVDGDGFGDPRSPLAGCPGDPGFSDNDRDCDDDCPECFPGSPEVCDARDNDCDGSTDGPAASRTCTVGDGVLAAECSGGACVISECLDNAGDCDADSATGCETDLSVAVEHCGMCGNACGAYEVCVASRCDDLPRPNWLEPATGEFTQINFLEAMPGGRVLAAGSTSDAVAIGGESWTGDSGADAAFVVQLDATGRADWLTVFEDGRIDSVDTSGSSVVVALSSWRGTPIVLPDGSTTNPDGEPIVLVILSAEGEIERVSAIAGGDGSSCSTLAGSSDGRVHAMCPFVDTIASPATLRLEAAYGIALLTWDSDGTLSASTKLGESAGYFQMGQGDAIRDAMCNIGGVPSEPLQVGGVAIDPLPNALFQLCIEPATRRTIGVRRFSDGAFQVNQLRVRVHESFGVLAAGKINSDTAERDYWLTRRTLFGDRVWTQVLGGPGADRGDFVSIAATDDSIFWASSGRGRLLAGEHEFSSPSTDGFVARLEPESGSTLWLHQLAGEGTEELIVASAIGKNLYIGGFFEQSLLFDAEGPEVLGSDSGFVGSLRVLQ